MTTAESHQSAAPGGSGVQRGAQDEMSRAPPAPTKPRYRRRRERRVEVRPETHAQPNPEQMAKALITAQREFADRTAPVDRDVAARPGAAGPGSKDHAGADR
jgi:hypothetical protein